MKKILRVIVPKKVFRHCFVKFYFPLKNKKYLSYSVRFKGFGGSPGRPGVVGFIGDRGEVFFKLTFFPNFFFFGILSSIRFFLWLKIKIKINSPVCQEIKAFQALDLILLAQQDPMECLDVVVWLDSPDLMASLA